MSLPLVLVLMFPNMNLKLTPQMDDQSLTDSSIHSSPTGTTTTAQPAKSPHQGMATSPHQGMTTSLHQGMVTSPHPGRDTSPQTVLSPNQGLDLDEPRTRAEQTGPNSCQHNADTRTVHMINNFIHTLHNKLKKEENKTEFKLKILPITNLIQTALKYLSVHDEATNELDAKLCAQLAQDTSAFIPRVTTSIKKLFAQIINLAQNILAPNTSPLITPPQKKNLPKHTKPFTAEPDDMALNFDFANNLQPLSLDFRGQ